MNRSILAMSAFLWISGVGVEADGAAGVEQIVLQESGQEPAHSKINVPDPSVTNRVTAGLAIQPSRIRAGESVTLFLKLRVAAGCHIYGFEKSKGGAVPTSIKLGLPNRLVPIDKWKGPVPKLGRDGNRAFSGDLLFQRRFRIDKRQGGGIVRVPIQISYQVCNEAVCWPPEKKQLECQLQIIE